MSFSPIQNASTGFRLVDSGGASPAIALPAPTANGNTVFLFFGAGLGADVASITDSQSNTWTKVGQTGPFGTDGANAQIWSATAKAGALTVTPAIENAEPRGTIYDPDGIGYVAIIVEVPGAWILDAAPGGFGAASVGSSVSSSITTANDDEVILAFWFNNSPTTQPATCSWDVFLAGNADAEPYLNPGGLKGAYMLASLDSGPAGAYTCSTAYATLDVEAPAGDWGASLVLAAFVPGVVTLTSDIVTDVCLRAGLEPEEIDVSLLTPDNFGGPTTNIVPGYAIIRPTPAKDVLRPLLEGYFFNGRESNGTMQWVPMGMASVLAIPEADLGLKSDGAKLSPEQMGQEGDLPQDSTVTYDDPTLDFQQNKQFKSRNARIVSTKQQKIMELPFTQTPDWARQTATKALYLEWLERFSYKFNLWRALYMLMDPADVITFTYQGLTFSIRIVEASIGAGLAIAISGVSEYSEVLKSRATGGQALGAPSNPLQLLGPTILWIFDIPLLRDVDSDFPNTGFYFAMSSALTSWGGGVLYNSTDNSGFAIEASSPNPATFGVATNTLGAPRSPWTWDRVNTLTVNLQRGAFASDTAVNVCNGSNLVIYGSEIIQFQTAVKNGDGSWTLSILLRGRRGTEWACGTHGADELVLMPATGIVRVQQPISVVNQNIWYKGATVGQDPAAVTSTEVALTGKDLMPYAPVHIKGARDGGLNLTINWIRRTRVGWLNLAQDPVPLSEDDELYQVDIYSGSSIVRSLTGLTSPTAAYSAADQTTDFGSAQASISAKVYQLSGEVGKGFVGVATV